MTSPINRRAFVTGTATLAASGIVSSVIRGADPATNRDGAPVPAKATRRLGLLSAATYGNNAPRTRGSNHGTAFATTLNGWDESKARLWKGTFVKSGRRLEGGHIVKI